MTKNSTVLIVPGLREHVPDHWQTLLAAGLHRVRTVPPLEHDKLSCAARVDALDRTLRAIDGPVILVAHSAGVMMVAHWSRILGSRCRIKGALLATPADVENPFPAGYPTTDTLREHGWLPIPRRPLPFPSLVAASRNDPLCTFERAQEMAHDWGSELEDLGPVGHLNPAAGYGAWPKSMELIRRFDRLHSAQAGSPRAPA
ncbi:RBBP9/YdeN family alpha/beta hydrolase [Lysobacter niabensis]|uniref:RBBP9/YdeN family alpha/beta hydrolase n=1 Tax=Agrilutibacter niabensis TaxID=380628 RepID=UPI003605F20C